MQSAKLLIKFYMKLYGVNQFQRDQIDKIIGGSNFLKSLPIMMGFRKTNQDLWLIYKKD